MNFGCFLFTILKKKQQQQTTKSPTRRFRGECQVFYLYLRIEQHGSVSGSGDVMKPQVFAAAPDETKLRARPRPPVLETA